jgi:hypothetical protein
MSNFTHFSLSTEKGLRGNIGKITRKEGKNGDVYMDMMIFLAADGDTKSDDQSSQIVNALFPQEAFEALKGYDLNDYVRVHFSRVNFSKGISKKTDAEVLYVSANAEAIELLHKAEKKETKTSDKQQEQKGWSKKH